MSEPDLNQAAPESIAQLITFGAAPPGPTPPVPEMASLFALQLASPLAEDLTDAALADRPEIDAAFSRADPPVRTLLDLFSHAAPPPELLRWVKEWAKLAAGDGFLPRELLLTLYYTAIATARVRCQTQISPLPPQRLLTHLLWIDQRPWLPNDFRLLVTELRTRIAE